MPSATLRAVGAFFAFCALSSAIYLVNDVIDRDQDRLHPVKRMRPVASGAVSPRLAIPYGVALLAAGLALGWATRHDSVPLYLGVYVAANALYTLAGKHVPILDVFLLGSFYVLRVLVGCALVDAAPSS